MKKEYRNSLRTKKMIREAFAELMEEKNGKVPILQSPGVCLHHSSQRKGREWATPPRSTAPPKWVEVPMEALVYVGSS